MTDQAARGGAPTVAAPPGVTGRERELRQLSADLDSTGLSTLAGRPVPGSRVLLVAGRPGSGRTALAEEFARRVAADYPGGVLRTRLSEPGGVPVPTERTARDLLARLRAAPVPPGADTDELTALLRAELTARRVLLLCDDVVAAEQVLELLPDSRGCLVVAVASGPLTSIPDVRPCTVGGLERGAAVELLRSRSGPTPRLTVDPRRAEALAEACGNLPAALVMVGGWLAARPKVSVSEATAELEGTTGAEGGPVPDRLARAFRMVFRSLPASSARLLRLLPLVPAGLVDAHTASALIGCPPGTAEGMLRELTALGLLRGGSDDRWTLPGCLEPLLRAESAAADRPAELMPARARMLERTVRRLHACWAAAEPAGALGPGRAAELPRAVRFADAAAADDWLTSRRDALVAAVRLAVAEGRGELDTLARRLAHGLLRCLAAHRAPEESAAEVYQVQDLVLQVARRRGLPRERAHALLALADLDAGSGRYARAAARYRETLDAARAARDLAAAARALEALGETHGLLGDWSRAADWYGRALAQRQTAGALADIARLHGRVADACGRAGDHREALREWRAAAAACRRLQDHAGQGRALGAAAREQERAGRRSEALRSCEAALAAARRARDVPLQAALRMRLAGLCADAGDTAAARRHRAAGEELRDLAGG
ncbi:NB-ARC domain-containing protein [Streptomyces sp. TR06-5]|uniref:NB-ARC domain-containing protein n=1 Tax=unclassified Streptomyces TaxID=2593676 RepID=UPI0039A1457A